MGYLDAIHYGLQDGDTTLELIEDGLDPSDISNWAWISIDSSVYDLQEKTLDICYHLFRIRSISIVFKKRQLRSSTLTP